MADVLHLDTAKLAHQAMLASRRTRRNSAALGQAVRVAHEADVALQALQSKRQRGRKARRERGWQPYGQR